MGIHICSLAVAYLVLVLVLVLQFWSRS